VRTPPPERRTLFIVSVFAVFLLLADLITGGIVRGAVHRSAAVISNVGKQAAETFQVANIFSSRAELEAHIEELEKELAVYRANDTAYAGMRAENADLRKMANLVQEEEGITAPVLLTYSASPYGTFMIGAGASDGVHEGSIVRSADGYSIGQVAEADAHTSIVKEFFAPGEKIEVMIGSDAVSLEGYGGGNARGQAAREAQIKERDIAVAQGFGGLPVGIVGKVVSDPANSFTEVYIRIPENLATVRFVYVQSGRK
jgi:cell shape-determining protein MreC